jgi:hypothetical protein
MASATLHLQGREIGPAELWEVRQLLAEHPDWSRSRISRALCQRWNWRTPLGQLKDMAARSLLLKLQQRGLASLPKCRQASPNRMRHKQVSCLEHSQEAIASSLADLGAIELLELGAVPAALPLFESLLHQFHYLSYRSPVGLNLKYLARDERGRPLACALFGSSAWQCASRDRFLGWDAATRQRNLNRLTNNTRFLILPWVQVAQLASHLLSRITARLRRDWQSKYGQPLSAVETFVDRSRFRGTCYQAANWIELGLTSGRTRQDREHRLKVAPKAIYLYPLCPSFRGELRA